MKRSKLACVLIAPLLVICLMTSSYGANIRFIWDNNGADNVFTNPLNWGGEAQTTPTRTLLPGDVVDPGGADATNVIIQSASPVNLTTAHTFTNVADVFILRGTHSLNIQANFDLNGTPMHIGQTAGTSTVNHSSGTVTTTGIQLGTGGTGVYNMSGTTTLNATDIVVAGTSSVLSLTGDSASIMASSLDFGAGTTLSYDLGATGVDAIDLTGAFDIDSAALITIDGSSYTGGPALIDLVTFASNTGTFTDPANISITGFGSFTTSIGYDSDSMFLNVVPEPSQALLSLIGLGVVALRRRRS